VGLEVSNSYRCHSDIVVPNVTTWGWRSYSDAGDRPWQTAALGDTQRSRPGNSERSAAIC
jgi:hypothetical protein